MGIAIANRKNRCDFGALSLSKDSLFPPRIRWKLGRLGGWGWKNYPDCKNFAASCPSLVAQAIRNAIRANRFARIIRN